MSTVFFPSDITIMCQALDIIYERLAEEGCGEFNRESLAQRVIASVRTGERDPIQIAAVATPGWIGARDKVTAA